MKIEMNGALITGRIDGLESFKVTIENKTDDNRIAKSFSSELTFYDDGFDLIKANLIDDPNGFHEFNKRDRLRFLLSRTGLCWIDSRRFN